MLALALVAAGGLVGALPPTTETSTVPVDRIVATGRIDGAPAQESRYPVTSIDVRNLSVRALDTSDVIERSRGVNVRQQGGIGARQSLSLDGLSGRRVRIFIDGVPAEVAGFGYAPAIVPLSLLDRVDIYRGVVPVALGSDALGGAVDYVTRAERSRPYAEGSYRIGSFQSHQGTILAGAPLGDGGLSFSVDGFVDGSANRYDIRVREGDDQGVEREFEVPQFNDGFLGYGAGASLTQRFSGEARLSARGFFTGFDDDLQHGVILAPPLAGEATSGRDTVGGLVRARLPELTSWLGADAWASLSNQTTRFRDVSTNVYNAFGEVVRSDSSPGELTAAVDREIEDLELEARLNLEARLGDDQSLLLGLNPNHVRRTGQIALSGDEDVAELTELVAGLEWTADWWDHRLRTTVFGKLYHQAAAAPNVLAGVDRAAVDRSTTDPGIGGVVDFRLWGPLSANVSYEWATRLPDTDEVFGDGVLVQSNPELRPERSHNGNLLLQLEGLELPQLSLDAEVGAFVREARDLIFVEIGELFSANRNIGGAFIRGVSSTLSAQLFRSHVDLFATLTYERATNSAAGARRGDQLPNRPTLYGSFAATGRLFDVFVRQDVLEAYWNARWVDEFFLFWEGDGRTDTKTTIPAQFAQDVGLTYDMEAFLGSAARLAFNAEVRNVTDEDLFDFYRVPRPGRAFFFKMTAIY